MTNPIIRKRRAIANKKYALRILTQGKDFDLLPNELYFALGLPVELSAVIIVIKYKGINICGK